MNSTIQPYSYKSPALYNPRLWNANEVRAYYVARPALLDRIVADLKREDAGNRPQHRLIVGLRGMGKSTLLRRLAIAVEDDAQLNAAWLPLSFPEEQYNVASLSDFWLNCLDALSDLLESRGQATESAKLDAEVEQLDRKDGEGALAALLGAAGTMQRRLLLLVDNIDLVFDRIKGEDWKLREILQAHPEILVVGASAKALEDSYTYGAAFYDFFKIDELRGLTEAEMRETIINLARLGKAEHIIERIEADPARLRVLHTLTGGNPRTAVLLYGVLLKGIDGDVRSDLEGLLDEVTPLYKARFEELPPLSQQLLDKLALHWHPANANTLAKQLGWKVNLVSAQLDRLVAAGIIEKVKAPKSKRLNFQIGERFFNIWYLMRTSRRLRRRLIWLVECLRGLYSNEELQAMAKQRMAKAADDSRDAETLVALSDALDHPAYKRALTDCALELLTKLNDDRSIRELFDLDGAESSIKERIPFIELGRKWQQTCMKLSKDDSLRECLETAVFSSSDAAILADAINMEADKRSQAINAALHTASSRTIGLFGHRGARLIATATQNGIQTQIQDHEGMSALSIRLDSPYLAALPKILGVDHLSDKNDAVEISTNARVILDYDNTGYLPWVELALSLSVQEQNAEAAIAAQKILELESTPTEMALLCCSFILDEKNSGAIPYLLKVLPKVKPDDTSVMESLTILATGAVLHGEGKTLLASCDKVFPNGELLPFREALNAATHNDVSLLELLAPEVKEPARQFLAMIAPQLLQHTEQ